MSKKEIGPYEVRNSEEVAEEEFYRFIEENILYAEQFKLDIEKTNETEEDFPPTSY